jgi:hypothetical protein
MTGIVESPLNIDLLTSRMLLSLASFIERTEDVCLLPVGGTSATPGQPAFNEFSTHLHFTMMTGDFKSFETLIQGGNLLSNTYFHHLTEKNEFKQAMQHIVESLLPPAATVVDFSVTVEVAVYVEAWLRWRTPACDYVNNTQVHNQIADPSKVKTTWNNLRFRSHSEMRIAIALDEAGVLFLPNCMGRLNGPGGRRNLECDFLVCHEGRWGILEVDGEPFHPPSRTVHDHERDRFFKAHGILLIEHFDSRECFENAKGVVQKFLGLLKSMK